MSLEAGRKLAHYEILEPIGKGGMGEVYKAKDSKLGRDVAIKVLPDEFARDEERLRRFQREAKVLASLNHPNVASIYGLERSDDTHYLVLELVPGETLAERISRGPIRVDEALEIATKIAEALKEAHERGIVHRDLKPANIKLTEDGKTKVLDFGLAKALVQGGESDAPTSTSPTITRDATRVGVILGTAGYMSPEQAKGKNVDRRTDVFAFGTILYEMLTGRKAFLGDDVSEILASVINLEPDWNALPTKLTPAMERMLRRCLNKDVNFRLQDIGDARIEIVENSAEPEPTPTGSTWRHVAMVAGVFALISLALSIRSLKTSTVDRRVTRVVIPLAPGERLPFGDSQFALSPDGQHVAYVGQREVSTKIFLRSLDDLVATPVEGTEGARATFFSSDGRWLGFHVGTQLMKLPLSGGAPTKLADVSTFLFGANWGVDDQIVYTSTNGVGLTRISAEGGDPEPLTSPDRARGEKGHRYAEVLPGGEAVLFTVFPGDIESFDEAPIAVLSLETGKHEVVIEGGSYARYCRSGHIVYARSGSLFAVPFDLETLRVEGTPVKVLDGLATSPVVGWAQFSLSRDGSLLYAEGSTWGDDSRVVSVDREGNTETLIEERHGYYDLALSPDGRTLAVAIDNANISLWVYDISRKTMSRLASGFDNLNPVWAPTGDRVAFASLRDELRFPNLFVLPTDGTADAKQLVPSEYQQAAGSWSPDGKLLAFNETRPETKGDILLLPMDGSEGPREFLQTEFDERHANFSPDGNWIAYTSDASGRDEIYIRSFHGEGRRWPVSTDGGTKPKWSTDGEELFYRNGDKMMVVQVETDPHLRLGNPKALFERSSFQNEYDVMPDGRGFVMIEESETPLASQLVLVQNWTEELERLVPTR